MELDAIFEKYVHVTQLGTNLKNVTYCKTLKVNQSSIVVEDKQ